MEALIIVAVLFAFWTQHILWKTEDPSEDQANEVKDLTDALKKLLEKGIDVNTKP